MDVGEDDIYASRSLEEHLREWGFDVQKFIEDVINATDLNQIGFWAYLDRPDMDE